MFHLMLVLDRETTRWREFSLLPDRLHDSGRFSGPRSARHVHTATSATNQMSLHKIQHCTELLFPAWHHLQQLLHCFKIFNKYQPIYDCRQLWARHTSQQPNPVKHCVEVYMQNDPANHS